MPTISKTIEINVPVERVFGFLTNPSNLPEIWPSMIEVSNVQKHADGTYAFDWVYKMVGVRFHGHADASEVEKNKRVFSRNASGIPSTFEYLYESVGGKTRLTMNVAYTVPGPVLGKLAEPVVHRINERETDAFLRNLKTRMELAAPSPEAHAPPH